MDGKIVSSTRVSLIIMNIVFVVIQAILMLYVDIYIDVAINFFANCHCDMLHTIVIVLSFKTGAVGDLCACAR